AQRAAVLRGGGYVRLLGPGAHWLRPGERLRRLRLEDPRVPQALQAALLADPRAAAELERVEVGARERALLWDAGRLLAILDPGRHALWRAAGAQVERLEVGPGGRVRHRALEALCQVALPGQLHRFEVGVGERGFLYADGVFTDELAPGRHLLWGGVAAFQLRRIEVRPHWVAAGRGLSAPCADRVPVGCELDLQLAAEDPRWAAEAAQDSEASLARQAEALLRAAIGRRPLAALLAEPQALEQALRPPLEEAAERLGWRLCDLAASVVALPEAVERAALRALEATEAARAERIRRREEAAATRSQLNTARMVASCPTLLRLKELEAAQGMASRARVLGVPAALGSRALGLLPRP
ncbi:MAG: SPFH domain-containing protein, partial [Planctomycetota bacterium]